MKKGSWVKNTQKNQHSLGVSEKIIPGSYETYREDIAEVKIVSIQPCSIIPDYKVPTSSSLPIVVSSTATSVCIDGWHFIEQARAAGKASIRCYIYYTAQHSDIEAAIRKTAIRVLSQGGKCLYPELVRNACRLKRVLQGISEELILYAHGGDRRSVSFTESQKNNIKVLLENRLEKKRKTINKYFQHGRFLTDEALESLIEQGASKKFFEVFQTHKQILISTSISEKKEHGRICEIVSKRVLDWFAEFQAFTSEKSDEVTNSPTAQYDGQVSLTRTDQRPLSGRRVARQAQEHSGLPAGEPPQFNNTDVANELKRIGEILIQISNDQANPFLQHIETLRELIKDLATLLVQIPHMDDCDDSANGEEK